MGLFAKGVPSHFIPVHPDNIASKDWLILLEAGTVVGPSPERLRVARTMQERKIVTKYVGFTRKQFLVLEGYDRRIHVLYFCPQLYRSNSDGKLVALQGEEIGRLIAHSLDGKVTARRPWYEPLDKVPDEPLVNDEAVTDFDTVVVEMPSRSSPAKAS